jgi:catechol 2,3-dioxygenase-like lactoylglutathione lyase family enzyme
MVDRDSDDKGGPMARVNGVHHLAMVVTDMERSLDFYGGVLGMTVKATTLGDDLTESKKGGPAGLIADTMGGFSRFYNLDMGKGSILTLIEYDVDELPVEPSSFAEGLWPGSRASKGLKGGVDHFAMNVETEAELVEIHQRLIDRGYEASEIQRLQVAPFWKQFFLYDPDGVPVEISTWDFADPAWETRKDLLLRDPNQIPVANDEVTEPAAAGVVPA